MDYSIRKYTDVDKDGLLTCIVQLQDHVAQLDPLKRIRPAHDFDAETYLNRTITEVEQHNGIILVTEHENQIAGCIVGIIRTPKDEEVNLEGYPSIDGVVLELLILPEYRGKGIGAALMEEIERYFTENNCSVVKVDCFAPNTNAHDFYIKLGYDDRLITLIKKL